MIKHFVMFSFRSDLPEAERQRVLNGLNEFPGKFPAMKNWVLGRNISRRDDRFSHAFTVEFDTEQQLLAYLNSQVHEDFVASVFRPAIAERAIVTIEL